MGTAYQPENDVTADGVKCWITGISPDPTNGDVDDGETTLLSSTYDMAGAASPVVRFYRWFTNDQGAGAGEFSDRFIVDASNDNGVTWTTIETVGAGTPLEWVPVEISLAGVVAPTSEMRFRFKAADLGAGSLVEAGIDEFSLIDRGGGCVGCTTPVQAVESIAVTRSGEDVVIEWTGDSAPAQRFVVYTLSGDQFELPLSVGTTQTQTFTHSEALNSADSYFYRVGAVDECGNESAR